VIAKTFAEHFSAEWIQSWNAQDMERILSHSDEFVMSSPLIAMIAGESSGTLHGKTAVAAYWKKALAQAPNLHFELISTLVGADSVTVYYKGVRGMAAEVFFFDANGKVVKSCAHYA
jgi:predicted ester cyclase